MSWKDGKHGLTLRGWENGTVGRVAVWRFEPRNGQPGGEVGDEEFSATFDLSDASQRLGFIKQARMPARWADRLMADLAESRLRKLARKNHRRPSKRRRPGANAGQLTDLGNADRLVVQAGRDLRYCGQWGKWLVWDGARWKPDESLEVVRLAKGTALSLWDEARDEPDPERQKAIGKWAVKSQSRDRLAAMVDLARCEVPVSAADLDADALKLNVVNGTIDLRTGELLTHRRADLITKLAPVRFDAAATCPRWDSFLAEIMDRDPALIDYLQRIAGYCLTADVREQVLLIFYGGGSNGKSVFLDTLTALLGDYAGQAAPHLLVERRTDEHPTEVADLMGKRLVVASETEEGGRLKINLVKGLTGNAKQKARFMRQDYFEFATTAKLILVTNNRPVIRENTHAAWRRLRLVPFNVTIPDERQDRELVHKLQAEWPGILAWAVRGCLAWQRDGLTAPESVWRATDEYRTEQDPLADFLKECCIVMASASVSRADLWGAYREWAERNRERRPLEKTALFDRIRRIEGVGEDRRRVDGSLTRLFRGIGLCFTRDQDQAA